MDNKSNGTQYDLSSAFDMEECDRLDRKCAVHVRFSTESAAYFNCEQPVRAGDAVIAGGREGVVAEIIDWLDIQDFPVVEKVLDEYVIHYDEIEQRIVEQVKSFVYAPIVDDIFQRGEYVENASDFDIENGVLKLYTGTDKFVRIPSCVTKIGKRAFCYYEYKVESVIIPASVKVIGEEAFNCRWELREVIFEGVPEEIQTQAFGICDNLYCVELPQGVKKIGKHAFSEKTKILVREEKDQPEWHVEWNGYALDGNVIYGYDPSEYIEENGLLFEASGFEGQPQPSLAEAEELAVICMTYPKRRIVIPETVRGKRVVEIVPKAFSGKRFIDDVFIPDTVDTIGEDAFFMSEIKRVVLPKTEVWIDSYAFGSSHLNYLYLPAGVRFDEKTSSQFSNIKSLKAVVVEEGVEWFPTWTFFSCDNLQSVILPESIVEISKEAFAYCEQLTEVIIKGDPEIDPTALPKKHKIQFNKKEGKLYLGCKEDPFAIAVDAKRR